MQFLGKDVDTPVVFNDRGHGPDSAVLDHVIDVPVAMQRHVPMVFEVVFSVQFLDKVIDMPVISTSCAHGVQTVQFSPFSGEPVEIPQAQFSCLVSCSHRSWTSVYGRCYADTRGDSTGAVLRHGF